MSCQARLQDASSLVGPAWPEPCRWLMRLAPNGTDWARVDDTQLAARPADSLRQLLAVPWSWESEEGEIGFSYRDNPVEPGVLNREDLRAAMDVQYPR